MPETEANLLTTLIFTTISIAMAAIFFCCWGKKHSFDNGDASAKTSGKGSTRSSPGKSEPTGGQAETNNAEGSGSKNGSTLVAKSPGFVDDSDDLGDFSAVSRETEILRSYRKPPPPKNRARQSRAPRGFKSSTENLDIFTELTEESVNFTETSATAEPESRAADIDQSEAGLLRPRPQTGDKSEGGPKREDVRSSMLADIEQTLAALHLKADDTDTAREDGEGRPATVSSRPHSRLTDDTGESGNSPLLKHKVDLQLSPKPSPKVSPKVSPKPSPKVSPKPVPKKRFTKCEETEEAGSVGEVDTSPSVKPNTEVSSVTEKPISITTDDTTFSPPTLIVSPTDRDDTTPCPVAISVSNDSHKEQEVTSVTSATLNETQESITELATEAKPSDTSEAADTGSPEPAEPSGHQSLSHDNITETRETMPPSEIQSSKTTHGGQSQSNKADDRSGDLVHTQSSTDVTNKDEVRENTVDTAVTNNGHANSSDTGDTVSSESSKDEQQQQVKKSVRQDSTEEHQGKGKVSKIPVRAGSKPRSSPPRTEKPEETDNQ